MNEEGLWVLVQVLLDEENAWGLDSSGSRVRLNAQLDTFQKRCGNNLPFFHNEEPYAHGKILT